MLILPLAAGEEERWAAPALSPLQVGGKNRPVLCALKLFRNPPQALFAQGEGECCIFALSSWLMWEMLSEMKENHHHAALMKSVFQHTMSLHFVGMTCGVSSHAQRTLRDAHTHTLTRTLITRVWLKTENLIGNPLKWQKSLFISCHPLSLFNNDTQFKKKKKEKMNLVLRYCWTYHFLIQWWRSFLPSSGARENRSQRRLICSSLGKVQNSGLIIDVERGN